MSLHLGLCSVTFRESAATDVVTLAVSAGVEGIEWGGEHVPAGSLALARDLQARCHDMGLDIPSYGSYLGMWADEHLESAELELTMDTAAALGAPLIRIWTRYGVVAESAAPLRSIAYANTAAIADSARERGLDVAVEFHPDTLTETAAGVNQLLNELARPNLYTYWQPDHELQNEAALLELGAVLDRLAHLHVYSWGAGGINQRFPLENGASLWNRALSMAAQRSPVFERRYAHLEFVRDDSPAHFVSDAACLASWIRNVDD